MSSDATPSLRHRLAPVPSRRLRTPGHPRPPCVIAGIQLPFISRSPAACRRGRRCRPICFAPYPCVLPRSVTDDKASGLPVLPWNTTATPPTTSAPTTPPPTTPLPIPLDYCPDGYYGGLKVRFNWGLGRITVVRSHAECADRCQQFSAEQFGGGCKAYMTGMYYGMLLCRSYSGSYMTSRCPTWAIPTSPGSFSGALGSTHQRTGQPNVGGNCCVNTTFLADIA